MIENEIVREIMQGGRVRTNKGIRVCAGNADIVAGGTVTVLNGMIIGWRRRAGAVPGVVAVTRYHLADATSLKMYVLDKNMEVLKIEDIAPPVSGATLLMHCGGKIEYLVWIIGTRCVIERNGSKVADFASILPSDQSDATISVDGYVDDSGDLVWFLAYDTDEPQNQWAKYKNDERIDYEYFTPIVDAQIEAMITERDQQWNVTMEKIRSGTTTNAQISMITNSSGKRWDYIYTTDLWEENYPTLTRTQLYPSPTCIDIWRGIRVGRLTGINEIYLGHRLTTEYQENAVVSPPEPEPAEAWVNTQKYTQRVVRVLTTKGETLSTSKNSVIPGTDYDSAAGGSQLLEGTSTYLYTDKDGINSYQDTYEKTLTIYSESHSESSAETFVSEIRTTRFSGGAWDVVSVIDSYGAMTFWLVEDGADLFHDSWLENAAYHANDNELIIVNYDGYLFRKQVGKIAEWESVDLANIVTKRF